jgi:hypothetical protein
MLMVAVTACVKFEPRPLGPEQITANFASRTLDNPKLKEFLETNLNLNFFNWPASCYDFSMLTPGTLYYHSEMDMARAKHASANTK